MFSRIVSNASRCGSCTCARATRTPSREYTECAATTLRVSRLVTWNDRPGCNGSPRAPVEVVWVAFQSELEESLAMSRRQTNVGGVSRGIGMCGVLMVALGLSACKRDRNDTPAPDPLTAPTQSAPSTTELSPVGQATDVPAPTVSAAPPPPNQGSGTGSGTKTSGSSSKKKDDKKEEDKSG